jgi:hypothetical protein
MIIEITGVTSGQPPYDIFICDTGLTSCFFVSGNTFIPPSVVIDTINFFPYKEQIFLKIIDTNGCIYQNLQDCLPVVVSEKEYEVLWGRPGVASVEYEKYSVITRETVTYPDKLKFSATSEPSFMAESRALFSKTKRE